MALEAAFVSLKKQAEHLKTNTLRDLFANDPNRFDRFTARTDDLLLDYSKSRIDEESLELLAELCESCGR